ncbi:MAG: Uma2 family endonuclease [Ilumatobacteraceae bacterium]
MALTEDQVPSHVIYPESDDRPMSESMLQGLAIRTLMLGFERLYAGRDDVLVFADQFWYPVKGEPTTVVAPDTMVVVGLPRNTWAEMLRKRQFYDRHGVQEYWVIDADHGALEVWVRGPEGLVGQPIGEARFVSPTTGVTVAMVDGAVEVRDPGSDRAWHTPFEEAARAEAAVATAKREAARADAEAARADAAERRLLELERRLATIEAGQSPS